MRENNGQECPEKNQEQIYSEFFVSPNTNISLNAKIYANYTHVCISRCILSHTLFTKSLYLLCICVQTCVCELTCAGAHVCVCMWRRGQPQVTFLRGCLPCADMLVLRQSVTAPALTDQTRLFILEVPDICLSGFLLLGLQVFISNFQCECWQWFLSLYNFISLPILSVNTFSI